MYLRKTILREPKQGKQNQTKTQREATHKTSRFPLLTPMDWAGRPKAAGSTRAPASKLSTTGSSHRNVCAWLPCKQKIIARIRKDRRQAQHR